MHIGGAPARPAVCRLVPLAERFFTIGNRNFSRCKGELAPSSPGRGECIRSAKDRRASRLAAVALSAIAGATAAATTLHRIAKAKEAIMTDTASFWPNNARLAVSISLMYEGGGQPISSAPGVIPEPIRNGLPDMPTNGVFQYGIYEGTPRLLDLMDKHDIKLSAFMIGQAVDKDPDLAKEVVRRGHEAAAHGRTWSASYALSPADERRFIEDNIRSIQRATGQTPKGWSAYWVRNSVSTLDILKSLGFTYYLDEASMDQPFIVPVKGGDFVTVPYTFHMNDIVSFPFENWNPAAYEQALKDEFDQLYEEGASRRRMMVMSLHDRISGHAGRVRVLDRFLGYAKRKPDVWFARKDEIADWALKTRGTTPVLDRGPVGKTGLSGPAE
jgi:peptidoglycan/xylan/chitin deacetylase (PgdA/CDA1 family)